MGTEPENPIVRFTLSKQAHHVREMEHGEHAALVEAIKLNFPEIYEKPNHPNCGPQSDASSMAKPAIQSPAPA
jgi:hypothetical protein